MKRASISLLSHLTHQKPNNPKLAPLLSKNYISDPTSSSSSSSSSSPLLNPCNKTHGLILKPHHFQANPSRNLNTLVEKPTQLSSRQRKSKEKSDLEEAFESAKTTEEMLQAFKAMESSFDDKELGLASLKLGLKLDLEGEDPEKTLSFANRALKVLDKDDNNKPSLPVAMCLQLLGSVNNSLKRFNDSLGYLNRANRILGRLVDEGFSVEDIRPVLHAVQLEIANVKTAIGRREEALENLRKCLEIKEMTLDDDSKELGVANRDLAEAYVAVLNFKEALPFALKALEIHKSGLGLNSV